MTDEAKMMYEVTRDDPGAWFEQHGKIWPKDRGTGLITPKQNYLQQLGQRVLNKFEELGLPARVIGLKPRQKGSTTWFSAVDYCGLRRKSCHACVIGGQYTQTNAIWEMMQTYQANDTFDWKNTGEINAKEGRWSNGSRLKAETAGDALAGISGTYQILHATEVARWAKYGVKNAAGVLTNILKCVPPLPGTVVILESTAEGASGSFFERWVKAIDAEDFLSGRVELKLGQYVRIFAPWFEFEDGAHRLSDEQKLNIQRTLDAEEEYAGEKELISNYGNEFNGRMRLGTSVVDYDVWEQLAWRRYAIAEECERDRIIFDRDYPHSWQDAFVKSGNLRFNSTGLSVMRKQMALKPPMYGIFEERNRTLGFRQTERAESQIIIYEKPQYSRKYILAVDPMTGATQVSGQDPDWHGVPVLRQGYWDGSGRWIKPAVVARVIPCRWDIDVLELAVWQLARHYGSGSGCMIVIEMNMDRGLTELLKLRHANLYQRQMFNQREMKTVGALGFQTSPKTRENLIETLAAAIRNWDKPGDGIDIWDENAITQLENFVKGQNGLSAAAEGFHDDDVLAIAMGLHLIDQATVYYPQRGQDDLPPDLRGAVRPSGGTGGAYT
jgi:hypothetical protein